MSTTVPFTACASTPLSSSTLQPSMTIVQPPTHTMLPSTNAMQPSTSSVQPLTPGMQPSTSFAHPSTPVVQPLTPVVRPSTPVMQPSIPIVQPSMQVMQPSIPVVQPWIPIVQSQTSHVHLYQPMSSATLAAANILKPTSKNSAARTFMVRLLDFCPTTVRSCFGCSQTLKPGGRIGPPPHDLVITSRMARQFRSPTTGELMHRDGNVYFHPNVNCIKRKQPYYDPRRTICPEWLI